MASRLMGVAYRARYHRFGRWSLDQWLMILILAAMLATAIRWWQALQAGTWWVWLTLAVLFLLLVAEVIYRRWAARAAYVTFLPAAGAAPPPGQAMDPSDKVLLHATGVFSVEEKHHFFAHLLAYWRTFGSREHAIMSIVHPSRFLLVGQTPAQDVGMWYVFFRPEVIEEVVPGRMCFGIEAWPGLRVVYRDVSQIQQGENRRRPHAAPTKTIYLAFDDEDGRRRVWSDLLADA